MKHDIATLMELELIWDNKTSRKNMKNNNNSRKKVI